MHRDCAITIIVASHLLIGALAPTPVGAQDVSIGVAAGMAVPTGGLATHRSAGPVAQLSVCAVCSERRVALRLDFEAAWFPGIRDAHPLSSSEGDLTVIGIIPTLVGGPRGDHMRPYVLIGAGLQRLSVPGRTNPSGSVPGVRLGAGFRRDTRRLQVHAGFAVHVILSDFGTRKDWSLGTYWPLTVGVRF